MRLAALAAAWTLGALVGGFLVQSGDRTRLAYWVERTRLADVDRRRLQQEASRLREQLALLAMRAPGAAVVESVEVRRIGPGPDLLDLEAALEPVTASILGQSPARIHFDLLWSLFANRVVLVRGRWYRLELKGVVLGQRTVVVLTTVPMRASPSR